MTATHKQHTTLRDRLKQATDTVAAWIADGDLTHNETVQLGSDAGLEVDGCAVWVIDGELRSFTCCTCCGSYAELAVKL